MLHMSAARYDLWFVSILLQCHGGLITEYRGCSSDWHFGIPASQTPLRGAHCGEPPNCVPLVAYMA